MNRAETFKSVWTNPIGIRAMLWAKLPLAAFAGLRVRKLDDSGAQVSLPAGWKTQNPFRSTYFAAQAMAAEMSTGAPALYFIEQSGTRHRRDIHATARSDRLSVDRLILDQSLSRLS